jgi:hypothetical protein
MANKVRNSKLDDGLLDFSFYTNSGILSSEIPGKQDFTAVISGKRQPVLNYSQGRI